MSSTTDRVRYLIIGPLATGLAMVGAVLQSTVVAAQNPPATGEPDLNATPVVVNGRISRPTLQPGSQGDAVIELQSVLMLLGYYSGPLSGVYQDNTQAAVQQFQTDAGINPDGIVGPATWSSLFPTPPAEANPPGTTDLAATQPEVAAPNAPTTQPSQSAAQTSPQTAETVPQPATPSETSPPAPEASSGNRPVLRQGDRGEAVRQLQEALKSLGVYNGPIDGIFGSQTESAVREVQADNGLTVDGIVGPATWGAIN